MDDKIAVIISVTLIALVAMFKIAGPVSVVNSVVSGLMGVAVGRSLQK